MNLKTAKLRGLIGLADGLGKEEVSVDLASVRGVVAIIGANGKGKTTFMECLQPFRILPSREILFKDAVNLRDSFKDITFDFGGKEYRVLVTADSQSGKMDGYLWIDGDPKTTGKVSELDEHLTREFGTKELFFASAFAAQSAESMLKMKASERKSFFVEFLGLGQLQIYSDRAKSVAGYLGGVLEGMRDTVARLERESQGVDHLRTEMQSNEQRRDVLIPSVEKTRVEIQEIQKSMAAIELKVSEQEAIRRSVKSLEIRRTEIKTEMDGTRSKLSAELEKLKAFATASGVQTGNWQRELRELEAKAPPAEPEQAIEPPQPNPRTAEIRKEISDNETKIDTNRRASQAVNADVQELNLKYTSYMADIEGKKTASKNLAALSSKIPSNADRAICGECGFAKAALLAVNDEKTLDQKLTEGKVRYDEQRALLKTKQDAIETNDALIAKRQTLHAEMDAVLRADKVAMDAYTALQRRIDTARKAVTEWQEQQRKIDTLKTSMTHREEQITETNAKVEAMSAEINTLYTQMVARLESMDAEIKTERERLNDFIVDGKSPAELVEQIAASVSGAKNRLAGLTTELENAQVTIGILNSRIEKCLIASQELESTKIKLTEIDRQRAEWDLLRQICGRDKLQALELDAAAPAITTIANNLLSECFGGRVSVRFITMDGDGREVFDLIVTDMHTGVSTALAMKSGGQKVIVLHALRLAITMYAKEKSGRDFRTMFLDECDGALSSDVRREFVEMNRQAMKMGGVDTLFMVSHSPEVIDCVDRVIEFTDNEIVVR